MIRSAAAVKASQEIEDLTEDQMAEVDRVLSILRGLRRTEAVARDGHIEDVFGTPAAEKFCFAGAEEDI